ncbi:hypothetical protein HNY73_001558 [Argiope bruennichi]|uniref:DUF7041 domain-containing protein n=1 Tax=Argiope bruennichi TaxID=94029 RepID=A0A8T0G7L8_ARGBR|nr:hypothetical protein HNY73_001558 [Argiope bruennichi]
MDLSTKEKVLIVEHYFRSYRSGLEGGQSLKKVAEQFQEMFNKMAPSNTVMLHIVTKFRRSDNLLCQRNAKSAVSKPITASKTKFNYCAAYIPPEVASIVRDIIINPDEEDPYQQLKSEVIKRCGESKSQEIRSLLNFEQLGDRKPSELLRVMHRRVESHHISDALLLKHFLQQMSSNVQSILTASTPLNVTKAAEVADRILEVTPSEVSKISSSDSSAILNSANSQSDLIEKIRALRKEAASLHRSRSVSR